ncbi:MAG: hypothetical protein ACE5LB_15245 [Acidiferrobacterales bacterium]
MAGAYTISNITDIAATTTTSQLINERGRTLAEDSRVEIFANREAVGVTIDATVGADQVLSGMPARIDATVGSMPSLRDDRVYDGFGEAGDEVVIRGSNSTAGALESRVFVKVTPVDDVALQSAMTAMGLGGQTT